MKKKLSIVLATSLAGLTLAGAGIASSIALTSCSSSDDTGSTAQAINADATKAIFGKIQDQLNLTKIQTGADTAAVVAAYNNYFTGNDFQTAVKAAIAGAIGNSFKTSNISSVSVVAQDTPAPSADSVTVNVTVKFAQGSVNLTNAASTSDGITVGSDNLSLVKDGMTFAPTAAN